MGEPHGHCHQELRAIRSYKDFKFRVIWNGRYVAGVSEVKAREGSTHRKGGDFSASRKSPGRTKYEAITLERGVTHDTEFAKWIHSAMASGASLADPRREVTVGIYN